MNSGFVMISRSFTSWVWYGDITMRSLFLDMIMRASFEDNVWRGVVVKRGQFVSSISQLARDNQVSEKKIRTCIARLEKCGELVRRRASSHTLFTLVNYDDLTTRGADRGQTKGRRNGKQRAGETADKHIPSELGKYNDFRGAGADETAGKGQGDGAERGTQYKEEIKKKIPPLPPRGKQGASAFLNREEAVARIESLTPNEELQQAAIDWLDMRLANKKCLTERALILTFSRLHRLASSAPEAVQIFEQSTINGWAGIFPVKGGAGR